MRRWTDRGRCLAGCRSGRRDGGTARTARLPGRLGCARRHWRRSVRRLPASVLVLASTQPPVTLCLTALSMRLLTSRSSRTRSPVTWASCSAVPIWICLAAAAGPIRSMASSTAVGRSTSSVGPGPRSERARVSSASISSSDLSTAAPIAASTGSSCAARGGWPGRGDVDQSAHLGQRRAQLVRRVGHEPALAGERRLQPGEHRVEGVGQFLQLIGRPGQGQPLAQVLLGGGLRRRGDGGQRPQHAAADRPAEPGCQHGAQAQPG